MDPSDLFPKHDGVPIIYHIFPQTSLRWLPSSEKREKNPKKSHTFGWFEMFTRIPNSSLHLYKLMEISLPPLLARKYHIVNISKLMGDDEGDGHYMGVATWFVLWSEAFGLQYLHNVHLKREKLEKIGGIDKNNKKNQEDQKEWRHDANRILQWMGNSSAYVKTSPTIGDNALLPSEFLLEPCVIAQLPWNNVLFHQWLAAALVEVLVFEKSSLELRHWPLPPELEPTARELLTVVKQLKERLVLGFAIMSQQVVSHPKLEESHPGWIMDEVVLPSLATLQFLINREAYNVLSSIKKIAWRKPESSIGKVYKYAYLHMSAYYMDEFLEDLFLNFCYNFPVWCLHFIEAPFTFMDCTTVQLKQLIERMNTNTTKPAHKMILVMSPERNYQTKEYSRYEYVITERIRMCEGGKVTNVQERIKITLDTIKKLLVKTRMIPQVVYDKIEKHLDCEEIKEIFMPNLFALELSDGRHAFAEIQMVVLNCLSYWEAHNLLVGSDEQNSVLARVISVGLEVMEREYLVRMVLIAAGMCDWTPGAVDLDSSPPLTTQSMTQTLEEVRKKRESHTRDWLWTQFPVEWRKPVSVKGPALQLSLGTAAIVKLCEEKIGRMVVNVARSSFGVFEKGGEVFPHWQTVQYILPCFVASFVELSKKKCPEDKVENMLKFVNSALEFYENCFHNWQSKIKRRKIIKETKNEDKKSANQLRAEINSLNLYLKCRNIMLQSCYVNNDNCLAGFPGFDKMETSLWFWPNSLCEEVTDTSFLVNKNCKSWLLKSYDILRDMYQISLNAWKPLPPGSMLPCKTLGEIYFAESVVSASFLSVLAICLNYVDYKLPDNFLQKVNKRYGTPEKRLEIWKKALNPDQVDVEDSEFLHFLEIEKKNMAVLYGLFKNTRQCLGYVKPKFIIDNFPTSSPECSKAVTCYINNNFTTLDKMLHFLVNTEEGKQDKAQMKVPPITKTKGEGPFEKCRNCPKTERKWGPFLTCEQCVEQKYPDMNFFCSKKCQQERWAAEHMAEHLEFELGLADFSHLTVG